MAELARARLEDYVFRVRAARKTAGLSAKEVADALGIPRSSYRRYERTALLPLSHVVTFCATVRCSPFYLMTGEPHHAQLYVLEDERQRTH